uniref:TonB-dependent transporter Oar-like beta-barrel domain-containing protein n=1 Tax=Solibacter usitatus (strain Ellin6076) TaxID=234267 RepID=Q021P6_SOLUE
MLLKREITSLLFVSALCLLHAQVNTGTITGTVTDPSGAVTPNVRVTVVQTETNFESRAVTNSEGLYRVQSLQPGIYRVTFEGEGFKRVVRTGLDLHTGDVVPVNVRLEVGQLTESIQVTANGTLLETETSASGSLTEGDTLYKMPLYQRYVLNALNLNPGMTMSGYAYGGSLGGFNVAGQRSSGTAVFEDGVLGNDPQSSSGTDIKPVENSVDEVKVLTGTLPAEYGHSTGGLLTVVKKGGTNGFHGTAADLGRTRTLTHRQFFNLYKTSDPQPGAPNGVPAWFMQPDASVSGPVVLPHIYNGRNKTFFFFGYQKLIEKKSAAFTSQTPTPDLLNGDFSFGGLGVPLYDPLTTRQLADGTWTRDPLPGSIVPKNRFDPVAAKIIALNPWLPPNTPGSLTSSGPVSNFTWASKSRTFFEDYSQRVDQQFNSNFKLYGSYTYNHQGGLQRPTSIAIPAFDGANGILTPFTQRNLSLGATKLFGPTALNEVRLGYYRARNDTIVPSYNQNWASTLGIPNDSPLLMPSFSGTAASGNSTAPGLNTAYGLTVPGPSRTVRETLSFRDDFSKMVGRHALKAGYEVLYFKGNYFQLGQPSGVFQFDNMTAGLQPNGQPVPNTGNLFAGFELGSVRQANFSLYTATWLPRDSIHSLYLQDDWKVTPTLTLNLGLRWSTESPYHSAHGQLSNFDPTVVDPVSGKLGAIVHPAGGLNNRSLRNFQPRIGGAWHPAEKWVFRGGFGINTVDIRFPNALQQFDEYQAQVVQQRAPGDPRPLFQLSQGPSPVQYNIQPNNTATYVGTNFGSRSANWMDGNLHPGYVMNWNTTVEYQISTNNLLKLMYQGSAGVHLVESWNYNLFPTDFGADNPSLRAAAFAAPQNYLPFTQFGSINYMSNTGHSTWHSGTIQFQKRYSQGIVLNTFYTFSKALDDCDSDSGTCSGVAPKTNRNLNKARAGYDRRHVFVTNVVYELPVGKGRHFVNHNRALDYVIGGWELAWVESVETGNPFGFSFTNSPNNYFPSSMGNYVPNLTCSGISMPGYGLGSKIGGARFNQALENPVLDVNCFAPPAAFTVGNAGRNIVTGPGILYSQASLKKNFAFKERWNLQLRFDYQNPFHNWGFNNPSNQVDFRNPQLFGKITGDQTTASFAGQPLMNLMLRLSW